MKTNLHMALKAVLFSSLIGCLGTPILVEAQNATGTWKSSFTTQSGNTIETTFKLKQAGDTLTGVVIGRDGNETAIQGGTVKDDVVAFKVTRERDGQSFTLKYQGTVSGDTIKGKMEFDRDGETRSRDWEAKREGAAADPTGTWKWSRTSNSGQTMESTLKLKLEGAKLTGAMLRRDGTETPIENGNFAGNEVSFKITRERNGATTTTKYAGKLSGDTIKGTISLERDGQTQSREWEAKRAGANATGTWTWTLSLPSGQSFEQTLRLKQEGDKLTGVMVRANNETPIQEASLKDGNIAFQVTRERNGQTFTSKYQGKLSGDSIKGKITSNFGGEDRTFDWDAKRAKADQ